MNNGLSENTIQTINSVFSQCPEIEKAIIFGSRAKGNYKNGSDIDIALFGSSVTDIITWNINAILNEQKPLPYYFDIISYNTLKNPDLKDHIDRFGKLFFENK
jgi:uncharacterized protein